MAWKDKENEEQEDVLLNEVIYFYKEIRGVAELKKNLLDYLHEMNDSYYEQRVVKRKEKYERKKKAFYERKRQRQQEKEEQENLEIELHNNTMVWNLVDEIITIHMNQKNQNKVDVQQEEEKKEKVAMKERSPKQEPLYDDAEDEKNQLLISTLIHSSLIHSLVVVTNTATKQDMEEKNDVNKDGVKETNDANELLNASGVTVSSVHDIDDNYSFQQLQEEKEEKEEQISLFLCDDENNEEFLLATGTPPIEWSFFKQPEQEDNAETTQRRRTRGYAEDPIRMPNEPNEHQTETKEEEEEITESDLLKFEKCISKPSPFAFSTFDDSGLLPQAFDRHELIRASTSISDSISDSILEPILAPILAPTTTVYTTSMKKSRVDILIQENQMKDEEKEYEKGRERYLKEKEFKGKALHPSKSRLNVLRNRLQHSKASRFTNLIVYIDPNELKATTIVKTEKAETKGQDGQDEQDEQEEQKDDEDWKHHAVHIHRQDFYKRRKDFSTLRLDTINQAFGGHDSVTFPNLNYSHVKNLKQQIAAADANDDPVLTLRLAEELDTSLFGRESLLHCAESMKMKQIINAADDGVGDGVVVNNDKDVLSNALVPETKDQQENHIECNETEENSISPPAFNLEAMDQTYDGHHSSTTTKYDPSNDVNVFKDDVNDVMVPETKNNDRGTATPINLMYPLEETTFFNVGNDSYTFTVQCTLEENQFTKEKISVIQHETCNCENPEDEDQEDLELRTTSNEYEEREGEVKQQQSYDINEVNASNEASSTLKEPLTGYFHLDIVSLSPRVHASSETIHLTHFPMKNRRSCMTLSHNLHLPGWVQDKNPLSFIAEAIMDLFVQSRKELKLYNTEFVNNLQVNDTLFSPMHEHHVRVFNEKYNCYEREVTICVRRNSRMSINLVTP